MPARPSVLVTRPQGQAGPLCAALEQAGFEAHALPLLELDALPELSAASRATVMDLDRYQHVIFVSGNAVRFGMGCIGDYWPQLPVGLNWYAVGSATAALLSGFGVSAVSFPTQAMDSEALLALPALADVAGQRVLIVKGEGGRRTLCEELQRRGATVDELACYRRRCPPLAAGELAAKLQQWQVTIILLSSGEALANMRALLSPRETTKFTETGLIVPSLRVARMAYEAGFRQVITAANASDAAMLQALGEWRARRYASECTAGR